MIPPQQILPDRQRKKQLFDQDNDLREPQATAVSQTYSTEELAVEIHKLVDAIAISERTLIALVLFDNLTTRQAVSLQLNKTLQNTVTVKELFLKPESFHITSLIERGCDDEQETQHVLFVYGLGGLPQKQRKQAIISLNLNRETIRQLGHTIVLWVTEDTLSEIVKWAPDFYAWRGGIYDLRTGVSFPSRETIQSPIWLRKASPLAALSRRELEERLQLYRQLLAERQAEGSISKIAVAQTRLEIGKLLHQLGDIEQSIHHFRQTLETYTREAFPENWAMTRNNLANAYSDRIRGERAENIDLAIEHYNQALEVYTREAFPEDWAMTRNNLANAYSNRIRGERAENIDLAIEHYNQALEVYTREAFPEKWAGTQNNLANAYSNRIRGERAENIDLAIKHYNQALEVRTREAFPEDWATTRNNLANAYSNRIRGERAENIDLAIE
ncbi:MAG: hypothetical protein C4B59_16740, partial [Candidatus Methanogaster sp.]